MKIRTRLIAGYVVVSLMVILVSATFIYGINHVQTSYANLLKNNSEHTITVLSEVQYYFTGQANDERGFLLTRGTEFRGEITAKDQEIKKRLQSIKSSMENEQERQLLKRISDTQDKFTQNSFSVIDAYNVGDVSLAMKLSFTDGRDMRKGLQASFDELMKLEMANTDKAIATAESFGKTMGYLGIGVSIFAIMLALSMGFYTSTTISNQIIYLSKMANKLAEGDLTVVIETKSKDEIGYLYASLVKMVTNTRNIVSLITLATTRLNTIVNEVNEASQGTSASMGQVVQSITQIASGAQDSATMVTKATQSQAESSAKLHTLTASLETVSNNTMDAVEASEKGKAIVDELSVKIDNMGNVISNVTSLMKKLESQAGQINSITEVIQGIAGNTNLLALNAAIEAARAGEQGRGFAVVAEEVRKLAEQSKLQAVEISSLIEKITRDVSETAGTVAKVNEEVAEQIKASAEVKDQFEGIFDKTKLNADIIKRIYVQSKQVTVSVVGVSSDMQDIAMVVEESAAAAEQINASAQEVAAASDTVASNIWEVKELVDELISTTRKFTI
ncbi:MAG TPA: methyl-accepting chemotaxis protein [Desulfosporosinus sp.]